MGGCEAVRGRMTEESGAGQSEDVGGGNGGREGGWDLFDPRHVRPPEPLWRPRRLERARKVEKGERERSELASGKRTGAAEVSPAGEESARGSAGTAGSHIDARRTKGRASHGATAAALRLPERAARAWRVAVPSGVAGVRGPARGGRGGPSPAPDPSFPHLGPARPPPRCVPSMVAQSMRGWLCVDAVPTQIARLATIYDRRHHRAPHRGANTWPKVGSPHPQWAILEMRLPSVFEG